MYLDKNIEMLKRKFSTVDWDLLIQMQPIEEGRADIEPSQKGIDTLKVYINGTASYLHSKYDPLSEAERIADSLELKQETRHLLFYGIGLGYVLDIIWERNPGLAYSIYEPDPLIFLRFLCSRKLSGEFVEALKGIYIKGLARNEGLDSELFFQGLDFYTESVPLPSYERVYAEDHRDFCRKFKDSIVDKRFRIGTKYAFEKMWMNNIMKNFPYTIKSENILNLADKFFRDKPSILVASGPSLDEEIENLKIIKGRGLAYIFCAGSAVYKLSKHGILPDAVCAIDGAPINYDLYRILFENPENKTPLIYADMVYHEVVSSYNAKLFSVILENDTLASHYLKYVLDMPVKKVKVAPSVALVTLQVMSKLQCDPIILVGQNFALKNDYYYAAGIDFHKDREAKEKITEKDRENSFQVEDVNGNMVYTLKNLDLMRRNMETLIRYNSINNIINTTKGGAKISGTRYITLEDVMKERLTVPVVVPEWYENRIESYDMEYIKAQHELMLEEKNKIDDTVKEIEKEIRKIEKAVLKSNENKLNRLLFDFSKKIKKLTRNSFYETFIYPMNTLQVELLTSALEYIAREENVVRKGRKAVKGYNEFIDEIKSVIIGIEPYFKDFSEGILNYYDSESAGNKPGEAGHE
ncbi:MAG: 6-hydroxymethylpterin diphosphokinase MptE-like protein [Clostridiaceae bacterium]|nr:6-hydroxymethylpterin diphosphokinase MptE-like protein [Clostridiaceae bacterium]